MAAEWGKFYERTKESPPSSLLLKALPYVKPGGKAIDIGAGALKDSRHLIAQGFDVTALDMEPSLQPMVEAVGSDRLHAAVSAFEDFAFPEDAYDLASAMYALPFNRPATFDEVFARIKRSLAPGGVLCGQFFGPHDGWAKNPDMTFHARAEAEKLLEDLETLFLEEREWDGRLADGTPKHWDVIDFIARKR